MFPPAISTHLIAQQRGVRLPNELLHELVRCLPMDWFVGPQNKQHQSGLVQLGTTLGTYLERTRDKFVEVKCIVDTNTNFENSARQLKAEVKQQISGYVGPVILELIYNAIDRAFNGLKDSQVKLFKSIYDGSTKTMGTVPQLKCIVDTNVNFENSPHQLIEHVKEQIGAYIGLGPVLLEQLAQFTDIAFDGLKDSQVKLIKSIYDGSTKTMGTVPQLSSSSSFFTHSAPFSPDPLATPNPFGDVEQSGTTPMLEMEMMGTEKTGTESQLESPNEYFQQQLQAQNPDVWDIVVEMPNRERVTVSIDSSLTSGAVKDELQRLKDIPATAQSLCLGDYALSDDDPISKWDLVKTSRVEMRLKKKRGT